MKYSSALTYDRAKHMRRQPTEAESKLWGALRNRRLANLKFYRQVPIGPYIVDFICHEYGVVIELDGPSHSTDEAIFYDNRRNQYLELKGLVVHRVWNSEVHRNINEVLQGIYAVTSRRPQRVRTAMKWLPEK